MGRRAAIWGLLTACAVILDASHAWAAPGHAIVVDVRRAPLSVALAEFARETGAELLFDPALVRDLQARNVSGRLTPAQALTALLAGTGLGYRLTDGAFVLFALPAPPERTEGDGAIAEILVMGRRTQNADIHRTENDIQAYKVITPRDLALTPYDGVDQFMRGRVTVNAQIASPSQDAVTQLGSTRSQIDLRGVGALRTLVLVDGRRVPRLPSDGDFGQSDLNGVPLGAIERIEILTSTAGGIYGSSAIGGVVNVVLRRDYRGADLNVVSGVTDRGDAAHVRLESRLGFTPDHGATDVMLFASYAESQPLRAGDRDFTERSRRRQYANNPAGYVAQNPAGDGVAVYGLAPLVFDAAHGGGALGSDHTFLPLNFSGTDAERTAELVRNAGQVLVELPPGPSGTAASLISNPRTASALLNIRRRFSERIEGFVDGIYFVNRGVAVASADPGSVLTAADAPSNPFTQQVSLRFPDVDASSRINNRIEMIRLTAGLLATLWPEWQASGDVSIGRSAVTQDTRIDDRNIALFGARTNGLPGAGGLPALDPLGDFAAFRTAYAAYAADGMSHVRLANHFGDASLRVAGPLMPLAGGPLTLTILGEARREEIPAATAQIAFAGGVFALETPAQTQTVLSAYGELRAPLTAREGGFALVRGLELQLAVREDSVRNRFPEDAGVGDPTNDRLITIRHDALAFTAGARIVPAPWVLLRGSVATGQSPAQINQLQAREFFITSGQDQAFDPRRGGQRIDLAGPYVRTFGGSHTVRQERGATVSAGVVFNPWSDGPRLSVDFSRITVTGEIIDFPLTPAQLLLAEATYPERVVRAAVTPADVAQGFTVGRVILLDLGAINAGRTQVDTVDFDLDWRFSTPAGQARAYGTATWQPNFRRRASDDAPWVQRIGYYDGPLAWRANAGLQLTRGPLTLDLNVQYFDSYRVSYAARDAAAVAKSQLKLSYQGAARIPSQAYVDLVARRRFDLKPGGVARAIDVRLAVLNLFDHSPPIDAEPSDVGYSTYGDPRRRRFELLLSAEF